MGACGTKAQKELKPPPQEELKQDKNNQNTEAPNHKPNHISMMVLGDELSGKTALIERYCNIFDKNKKQAYECKLKKQGGELGIETEITLSIEDYSRGCASDEQHKKALQSDEHQVYIICFAMDSQTSFNNAIDEYRIHLNRNEFGVNLSRQTVMFAATGYGQKTNCNLMNKYSKMKLLRRNTKTDENVNLLFEKAVANQLGCKSSDIKTCAAVNLNQQIPGYKERKSSAKVEPRVSMSIIGGELHEGKPLLRDLSSIVRFDADVDDIDIDITENAPLMDEDDNDNDILDGINELDKNAFGIIVEGEDETGTNQRFYMPIGYGDDASNNSDFIIQGSDDETDTPSGDDIVSPLSQSQTICVW